MREPGKPKVSKNGESNGERERNVNLFINYPLFNFKVLEFMK